MRGLVAFLLALFASAFLAACGTAKDPVTVGSKKFTESVILGEMARNELERAGIPVTHQRELGGSRILWDALVSGEIDIYPEYTGTLRFEILSANHLSSDADLPAALARHGIGMTRSIGFSNGYALAMRKDLADELGIEKISDLAHFGELDIAVSNEFVDRADGWPALSDAYGLAGIKVRGIDHDLAYRALDSNQIDVTDAYTTDAEIKAYDLKLLQDDRAFFPRYDAVYLYRKDLPPPAVAALEQFAGTIDEAEMQGLNRKVRMEGWSELEAAADALDMDQAAEPKRSTLWEDLRARTLEHLSLVAIAMAAAIAIAIPLGIVAAHRPRLGGAVMSLTGIMQTIPSLALFVMLIPVMGIGAKPTIAALFLYSLLPIVRNTHAGLTGIAPELVESAKALGLSRLSRLKRIEFPLAFPTILAGIRTAAVIAVGLATLGAIIGAGGYGQPILTGIRLNNNYLILQGAIPAALMALAFEGLFHAISRKFTPGESGVGQG